MRFWRILSTPTLALLLTGCTSRPETQDWHLGPLISVMHGQVDFASRPTFEWNLGSYRSVMCFGGSTVIRVGGTYCIIGLPYYALLFALLALALLPVALFKLRKRRYREKVN